MAIIPEPEPSPEAMDGAETNGADLTEIVIKLLGRGRVSDVKDLFVWLGGVLSWLFSMATLFLVIYGAIRLALKHDRRSRIPRPREAADAELRERVAAERAAQKREAEERSARRREAEEAEDV